MRYGRLAPLFAPFPAQTPRSPTPALLQTQDDLVAPEELSSDDQELFVSPGTIESGGGEPKCRNKRKRDDTELDDDDTVAEDSENDGQVDGEMEDDNTAGGEFGNAEQEGEEVEDRDMADEHAGGDGSAENEPADDDSQDGDYLFHDPLKAESQWPYQPARTEISKLATCLGLDHSTANGLLPSPSARDAIVNALASVKFLNEFGQSALLSSQLGIDSAGRLFRVGSCEWKRNYRREFCDLAQTLTRRREETPIKEEIQQHLQAYVDLGWSGYLDECTREETEPLVSIADTVVKEGDFEAGKLEAVMAECKTALAKMDQTVSLINAVKQDLLDTGSTSLKRWGQLKKIRWLWRYGRSIHLSELTANGISVFVEEMTKQSETLQASLGLTLKLKGGLDYAIEQLAYINRIHGSDAAS